MIKKNYQKMLDDIIKKNEKENIKPKLLLHSCCAPCSSHTLEYLHKHFDITVWFYNPNIQPKEEFEKRAIEQAEFIKKLLFGEDINFEVGDYNAEDFLFFARDMSEEPEGGKRCYKCYEQRLKEAAVKAKQDKYDMFTTTLSISPHKNAMWINEIGEKIAEEINIKFLNSDFKKKNGYKRSIELSKEYDLYRQDYCGCIYSKIESEKRRQEMQNNN